MKSAPHHRDFMGTPGMDPEGPLGARLREIEFPESAGLSLRVIDRHRSRTERGHAWHPPRARLAAIAAMVLALLVATMVAVPGGRQALAAAPVVGPFAQSMLRLAGLDSAGERVAPLQGQAASAGYTVALRGGYADNQRTVVILHVDPAAIPGQPVSLAVDHGAPLVEPVISPTAQGDVVLVFGPIANPDPGGNALTLHFEELGQAVGPPAFGDWTLHFSLTVDAAAAVAPPASGHIAELSVSFKAAVVNRDVEVTTELSGVPFWQLYDFASEADAGKGSGHTPGPGRFSITLTDGSAFSGARIGTIRDAVRYGSSTSDLIADNVWSVPEPGVYVLMVSWRSHVLVRFITVR